MQPDGFIRPHTAKLNQVVTLTEVIYCMMVILVLIGTLVHIDSQYVFAVRINWFHSRRLDLSHQETELDGNDGSVPLVVTVR